MQYFFSLGVLSAVVLVVGVLERLPRFRWRPLPIVRHYLGTDLAWYLVAAAASAISAFAVAPLLARLALDPISGLVGGLPSLARLLLAVAVFDLVSYASHVGMHHSETLWCVHKVHHSSHHLDGLATTRSHMFENLVRFAPAQAVLLLIGVPPAQVAIVVGIYAIFGVLNHSNLGLDVRWLEAVFVTPRLHRRHHVPDTSDRNFGTIFSLWDRVRGRLVRIDTEAHERFGVPGEIDVYPQRFRPALRQPALQVRRRHTEALAAR